MVTSNPRRPRTGLSVTLAAVLVLIAGVGWAQLTTPTVSLYLQPSPEPHFGPDSFFDVLVTLDDNDYTTAPLGANFRIFFDNSVSTPTAILGNPNMSVVGMGKVEGTAPNNWFDIAVSGAALDPTPDFCILTFKALQFLNTTSPISIGDDPDATINLLWGEMAEIIPPAFPYYEWVQIEIPHEFGPALNIGPTVPPSAVADWHLFR